MIGNIERILDSVKAEYADIRYERMRKLRISFSGRELTEVSPSDSNGFVLRVLKDGGFSSVPFTEEKDAGYAIERAQKNARIIGRSRKVKLKERRPEKGEFKPDMSESPEDFSIEEKIELLKGYNEIPLGHRDVTTTNSAYDEVHRERLFVGSDGTEVSEDLVTVKVMTEVICRENTNIQSAVAREGSGNGLKPLRGLEDIVEEKTRIAIDLLKARPARGGRMKILADPRLAGVFTHEAFGHFSEADLVEDMPFLRERMKMNTRLGSDALSITADPTMKGVGYYRWDDEGVRAERVRLMDKGILSGRLHSRRTAAEFEESLTGHCVAEDYRYAPIVRMGNIFIERGEMSEEELMKEIKDGLYLFDTKGGQTMGEQFTFSAGYGYEIRNGEIRGMVRNANLMGNIFETLKGISAVGKNLSFTSAGTCGKGQLNIRSPMGAPTILIENALVGGE